MQTLAVRGLVLGLALLCASAMGLSGTAARAADPEWAAVGSLFLPGVGQAANGDLGEGALQAGLYLALANQYLHLIERPDFIDYPDREDPVTHTVRINRTSADADGYGTALLNLSFYSAFGAYRDARNAPGGNGGYRTPAPAETLADLALAPFNPRWLVRPTTLAPLLIPLYFALSPADREQLLYAPDASISRAELRRRAFVQHYLVGIGEEAFFRGFLNNGLSDRLGEGWGLAASSTAFGLAHSGTAGQATAAGAALFGAYLGWLQQHNDYAIGQGVAIHFWWNFLTAVTMLKERPAAEVTLGTLYLRY